MGGGWWVWEGRGMNRWGGGLEGSRVRGRWWGEGGGGKGVGEKVLEVLEEKGFGGSVSRSGSEGRSRGVPGGVVSDEVLYL